MFAFGEELKLTPAEKLKTQTEAIMLETKKKQEEIIKKHSAIGENKTIWYILGGLGAVIILLNIRGFKK